MDDVEVLQRCVERLETDRRISGGLSVKKRERLAIARLLLKTGVGRIDEYMKVFGVQEYQGPNPYKPGDTVKNFKKNGPVMQVLRVIDDNWIDCEWQDHEPGFKSSPINIKDIDFAATPRR